MTFIGNAVLFFFAGFTGYLINADRGSSLGVFLLIGLPVAGVYFLGWWALLTFIAGAIFGGRVFWSAVQSGRIGREE
jgi:hypothetical protein